MNTKTYQGLTPAFAQHPTPRQSSDNVDDPRVGVACATILCAVEMHNVTEYIAAQVGHDVHIEVDVLQGELDQASFLLGIEAPFALSKPIWEFNVYIGNCA